MNRLSLLLFSVPSCMSFLESWMMAECEYPLLSYGRGIPVANRLNWYDTSLAEHEARLQTRASGNQIFGRTISFERYYLCRRLDRMEFSVKFVPFLYCPGLSISSPNGISGLLRQGFRFICLTLLSTSLLSSIWNFWASSIASFTVLR